MTEINKKSIIYIAGYGRSGSTLLERILNSHEEVFGAGEIINFSSIIRSQESFCSCGQSIEKCKVWSKLIKSYRQMPNNLSELEYAQNQFEKLAKFFNFITVSKNSGKKFYKTCIRELFNAIFKVSSHKVRFIVDSSKTTHRSFFRPLALSKIADMDVKLVHLVRDSRGCIWSNIKGSNRKMEKGIDPSIPFATFRTVVSWLLANIAAHIFQFFHPSNKYLRIKYEDLVMEPSKSLRILSNFLDIDLSAQIEMLEKRKNIPLSHQLSGNRLRSQEQITLIIDKEWKSNLGFYHKLLFVLLNWPLAIFYGYQ